METKIKIFSNPHFGEIRIAGTSDQPLFCLADICRAIGISNNRNVKNRLDGDDVHQVDTLTAGGMQSITYVSETGLYDVILRSDSVQAKPFRKWVTSEVLPSIRKTGGYIATYENDSPELIMARALQVAHETLERHKQRVLLQQQEINKLAPKAEYTDEVLQSVNTYTSTQMAKELQMTSAIAFHKKLHEKGIMFKQSGQWMLSNKYSEKGYTKTRTHSYSRNDGNTGTNTMTVWTESGRMFLHDVFATKNDNKQLKIK